MSIKTARIIAAAILLWAAAGRAEVFTRQEVQFVGSIDYGETSGPVRYTAHPRYRAFAFNGKAGDRIEVTVHSKSKDIRSYLANAKLEALSGGAAHFSATLPAGSQPSTYYILVTGAKQRPFTFSLQLERPST